MKYIFAIIALIFPLLIGSVCDGEASISENSNNKNIDGESDNSMSTKIKISIGNQTFTATLLDNAATKVFKSMLPLTVTMTELNGNEKYYHLPENLPVNASNPGTIYSGDLVLWGSNTLVVFYKTFSTSYSYTRLGKIDNPSGLAEALGSGNISVSFMLL